MLILRRWSVRHAGVLEHLYRLLSSLLAACGPLFRAPGYAGVEKALLPLERNFKGLMFDCRMCGHCLLSVNGMACPMNCPKSVRNGPCGGVRPDGGCEVDPQMQCVWVEGWRGTTRMTAGALSLLPNAPANAGYGGSSSWMRFHPDAHT